uniref:Uncharacterized protein n=1 Tax=Triticum urartu TaxID=4572 RepID=A0A8R7UEN8_TRIUA
MGSATVAFVRPGRRFKQGRRDAVSIAIISVRPPPSRCRPALF